LIEKGADLNLRDVFGWTALLFAVNTRSVESVSTLHFSGANFGIRSYDGDSGLHVAVRADDAAMIQVLLTDGDVEEPDVEGHTPLMIAACAGLANAASTLLAFGASVKVKDHHKRSPFMQAVVHGHKSVVQLMLEPLKPPPKLPQDGGDEIILTTSAPKKDDGKKGKGNKKDKNKKGKPETAEADAEGGPGQAKAEGEATEKSEKKKEKKVKKGGKGEAEENSPRKDETQKKKAKGPIIHPAVKLANAEAEEKRKPGQSISAAALKKKLEKAPKGLRGATPDELIRKTIDRRNFIANKLPYLNVHKLLKEADSHNRSALQLAVFYRHAEIVHMLMAAHADVHRTNDQGNTILHDAAITGQQHVVGYCLDAGVDIYARNNLGLTAKLSTDDPHIRGMIDKFEIARQMAAGEDAMEEEQSGWGKVRALTGKLAAVSAVRGASKGESHHSSPSRPGGSK